MTKSVSVAAVALLLAALAAGAWYLTQRPDADARAAAPASAARGGSPGATVAITSVPAQQRDFPPRAVATGTVTALNSVEVRPQIASTITKVHIREGQFVHGGPAAVHARRAQRRGQRGARRGRSSRKDLAALADAQRQLARSRDLLAQNFISQGAVDTNQTLVDAQRRWSRPTARRSRRRRSRLSYTPHRRAVARGAPARSTSFAGSFVQPTGTALVTITQLDPIAVAFSLPQRNLGRRAGGAARRRRQGHGDAARGRGASAAAASCSSSTTRSTPTSGTVQGQGASSPTRTSGSGPAPSSTSGWPCRR